MQLPSKEEMLSNTNREMSKRFHSGLSKKRVHFLGLRHEQYFPELAEEAKIKEIPPVVYSLFRYVANSMRTEPLEYRKIKYDVIDDSCFTNSIVD